MAAAARCLRPIRDPEPHLWLPPTHRRDRLGLTVAVCLALLLHGAVLAARASRAGL
jgi:hypothetical protein